MKRQREKNVKRSPTTSKMGDARTEVENLGGRWDRETNPRTEVSVSYPYATTWPTEDTLTLELQPIFIVNYSREF